MAKTNDKPVVNVPKDDRTPEQRLKDDWPARHKVIAQYITELGKIRTGLVPSQIKEAKRIRKQYGFED